MWCARLEKKQWNCRFGYSLVKRWYCVKRWKMRYLALAWTFSLRIEQKSHCLTIHQDSSDFRSTSVIAHANSSPNYIMNLSGVLLVNLIHMYMPQPERFLAGMTRNNTAWQSIRTVSTSGQLSWLCLYTACQITWWISKEEWKKNKEKKKKTLSVNDVTWWLNRWFSGY